MTTEARWQVGQQVYLCHRDKTATGSDLRWTRELVEKVGRLHVTVAGQKFQINSGRGVQYPGRWISAVEPASEDR